MVAKRGTEVLIKRGDGASPETFTTVGAIRNARVAFNGNPIDVTTADDVDGNNEIWRTRITGVKDLSISGDGLAKSIEPIQSIYEEEYATGVLRNYQVVVPYVGTWEVAMIVSNLEFGGDYDGAADFSITLDSASAPTFTPESA